MKILMTGGTGLIGQSLGQRLSELGHDIVVVTRSKQKANETLTYKADIIECDLNLYALSKTSFNGVDAIINLAGESIDGHWNADKKDKIIMSRVKSVQNLLLNCPLTVKTIVSASAQGIYGNRGNEILDENSDDGQGFLAEVCRTWENAFKDIEHQRLVLLRIGIVLSHKGGALKKLISIFQKNMGAVLGSGEQWMSLISLRDITELFVESLINVKYQGVVNAVNNSPVTNEDLTLALSKHLNVIKLPAVPGFMLKILMGEMSDLLLNSLRVTSQSLKKLEFEFQDTNLDELLKNELSLFDQNNSLFQTEQFIPAPLENVFSFFSNAHNLETITPDFLNFKIKSVSTSIVEAGTLIDYGLKLHGIPLQWRTLIETFNPPHRFSDRQLKGPYKLWHHTHYFKSVVGGTLMTDVVRYKLPIHFISGLFAGSFVRSEVQTIFDYRRKIIAKLNFN